MCSATFLSVIVSALGPPVPVLDFSMLPKGGGTAYSFDLVIRLQSGAKATVPVEVGKTAQPDDVYDLVHAALAGGDWGIRNDGLHLMILDYKKSPVVGFQVKADGPRPTWTWKFRSASNPAPLKERPGGKKQ